MIRCIFRQGKGKLLQGAAIVEKRSSEYAEGENQ